MSEYDCIGVTSEYLETLKNKIKELEQQNKELREALESSYKIMKSFSDKGGSAIAVQARKNKKILLSSRNLKQEVRDEVYKTTYNKQ